MLEYADKASLVVSINNGNITAQGINASIAIKEAIEQVLGEITKITGTFAEPKIDDVFTKSPGNK